MEKYKIIVSEPWDYKDSEGKNIIVGRIARIVSEHCLVFQSDATLTFNNLQGSYLVLFTRVKNDTFNNIELRSVYLNGGLIITDMLSESAEQLEDTSNFVVIGNISKL